MKKTLITLIISITSIGYAQSPWVYQKGKGYSHISIGSIPNYTQVFDGGQNNLKNIEGHITEVSLQSYTELGLGAKTGIYLSLPLNYIQSSISTNNTSLR